MLAQSARNAGMLEHLRVRRDRDGLKRLKVAAHYWVKDEAQKLAAAVHGRSTFFGRGMEQTSDGVDGGLRLG
jgi:hypothetical protein